MRFRIVNRFRFITFVVIVILAISLLFAGIFNTATALDYKEEKYIEITICEGDTLWNLAKKYGSKEKDVREVIYDICKLNSIEGANIYSGQVIRIPEE